MLKAERTALIVAIGTFATMVAMPSIASRVGFLQDSETTAATVFMTAVGIALVFQVWFHALGTGSFAFSQYAFRLCALSLGGFLALLGQEVLRATSDGDRVVLNSIVYWDAGGFAWCLLALSVVARLIEPKEIDTGGARFVASLIGVFTLGFYCTVVIASSRTWQP